ASRLNCGHRRASTSGATGGAVQAPESAGAVIGLDDICPKSYRLAQWTSASNPGKDSKQLDIVDDGVVSSNQQSMAEAAMSRRGSKWMSLLLGRMAGRFLKASRLAWRGSLATETSRQQSRTEAGHTTGKKKLSDGADSQQPPPRTRRPKATVENRRRTLAPRCSPARLSSSQA
uniref:Os01g0778700 protein n=1 Tax=Macrostomum lignano TaxID=282301 RepID=A0A1I8FM70_9PLAT